MITTFPARRPYSVSTEVMMVDYYIRSKDGKTFYKIAYLMDTDYHGYLVNFRYVVTEINTNHKFIITCLDIVDCVAEMLDELVEGKAKYSYAEIKEFAENFSDL